MVRAAGFEPAATGSQSRSATAAPRPELKTLPCCGLHCTAQPRLAVPGPAALKAFPLPFPPPVAARRYEIGNHPILVSRRPSKRFRRVCSGLRQRLGSYLAPLPVRPSSRRLSKSSGRCPGPVPNPEGSGLVRGQARHSRGSPQGQKPFFTASKAFSAPLTYSPFRSLSQLMSSGSYG